METILQETSAFIVKEGGSLTKESPARDQSPEELMTLLLAFGLDQLDVILYFTGAIMTLTWEQQESIDHGLERITFRPTII